jgi:ribulose bisphosphate carboxylase small subunit
MNIPHSEEAIKEVVTVASDPMMGTQDIQEAAQRLLEYGFKAGVEASKGAVPEYQNDAESYEETDFYDGYNHCREITLKNMESLITSE